MKSGALAKGWYCAQCERPTVSNIHTTQMPSTRDPINEVNESDAAPMDDEDGPFDTPQHIADNTFNINARSFDKPSAPLDDSLLDQPLDDDILDDQPVTYKVVEGGTKRGGKKLVGSDGYTYVVNKVSGSRVFWACSVRGKIHRP